MKRFSFVCTAALLLGCQGVVPSLAEEPIKHVPSQATGSLHAQSSSASTASTQFQNIEGLLKEIQGNVYVVDGGATSSVVRVEIGRDTAFPNGQKEPGQMVQALISSSDGHALIVR